MSLLSPFKPGDTKARLETFEGMWLTEIWVSNGQTSAKNKSAGGEIRMGISSVSTSCLSALNLQNTIKWQQHVINRYYICPALIVVSGWRQRDRSANTLVTCRHEPLPSHSVQITSLPTRSSHLSDMTFFFLNICSGHSQNTRSEVVELRYWTSNIGPMMGVVFYFFPQFSAGNWNFATSGSKSGQFRLE